MLYQFILIWTSVLESGPFGDGILCNIVWCFIIFLKKKNTTSMSTISIFMGDFNWMQRKRLRGLGGLGELAWIFIADRLLTDKETNEGIPRTQKWRPEDYNTLRHVAGYCLVIIWALTKHRDDIVVATGSTSWPWSWRSWWPKNGPKPSEGIFRPRMATFGGSVFWTFLLRSL